MPKLSELSVIEYSEIGRGILHNSKRVDTKGNLRGYYSSMKNMFPLPQGGLRTARGYADFLDTAISGTPTITSGFCFFDKDSTQRTIITTSDGKLRLYDGTDFDTELMTGLTTGVSLVWCWFVFYDGTNIYAIGCNGQDGAIKTDGTLGGTASLGGSPPSAPQWGCSWKDRVWLTQGNDAYHSDVLNEDSWDTTNNKKQYADDNSFGITGLYVYDDNLITFKPKAIYKTYHQIPNLTSTSAFSIKRLPTERGCVNGNTIVILPSDELEFLDRNDFVRLKGDTVYPVGGIFTEGYFNPNLDYENIDRSRILYFNSKKLESSRLVYHNFATTGTQNHISLLHDYSTDQAQWFPATSQNFHCMFEYESSGRTILLAGGQADGMVYLLDQGNQYDQDSTDAEFITLWDPLGNPDAIKYGYRIEFIFEARAQSTPTVYIARDFDTTTEVSRSIIIGSSGDVWGDGRWGSFVWGDLGNAARGYIEFDPHPDSGDTGFGEFKSLRLRMANPNINQPFAVYGWKIYFKVLTPLGRRET